MSSPLRSISIQKLYPFALAEGEGVGTAYEYYAKRLVLAPFLRRLPRPQRILVAGLPEKYGSSLDFLLLASELQADVVVADHRPAFLAKSAQALGAIQGQGLIGSLVPRYTRLSAPTALQEVDGAFDLALCCEVLQALPAADRPLYWEQLWTLAPAVALFAPNADNPAHSHLSGLKTLHLAEIAGLVAEAPWRQSGLADLPPFPSGMTRSAEQRQQAASGAFEQAVMWGLNVYARLEKFVPGFVRRRYAHMVYALALRPS
jgi:hypothetical protein